MKTFNSEMKTFKLPTHLEGNVLKYWKTLADDQTYDQIKKKILEKFKRLSKHSREREFYNDHQPEADSVLDFGLRLQSIFNKAFKDKDEKILIKQFLHGLHRDISTPMLVQEYSTYEKVMSIDESIERKLKDSKNTQTINNVERTPTIISRETWSNGSNKINTRDRSRDRYNTRGRFNSNSNSGEQ
jgi:hypothetical protein